MIKNKNTVTLLNVSSTIILQGLAFISGPVFSGILGTNNYGIASVYHTWMQLASTVFSLQAASTVAVARVNFSKDEQKAYQSSVLSLASISYLVFSFITIIASIIVSQWTNINLVMIALGLVQGWGLYCVTAMNNIFTYEFKADKNFILSVLTAGLTIGLSILLIHLFPKETNYWGRIIGQSSVYCVIGVILLIYILLRGKTIYSKRYWSFTIPLAIPTVFHLLAHIVLNQSDKVMIQAMINNSAAGIYALSCTFATVLGTIYHALNNSWVPFYYEYTRNAQIDSIRKHGKNYIELFTIIASGFILLSPEVFHVYANKAFWDGTAFIPLFSIGFYFVFLYSFPVNYEFYNKKTKTIAVGTTLAALCNIILNYIMIKLFGITGAVIATAIAHGLQFVFHFICAKRINPGEFPFGMMDFLPGLIFVGFICVIFYIAIEIWIVRWGISAILGGFMLLRIIKRREIF